MVMGMIAAPWMRASPEALDTGRYLPGRLHCATCRRNMSELGAAPGESRSLPGPGDRRKLSPPEARRAAKPRSRARITRGEDRGLCHMIWSRFTTSDWCALTYRSHNGSRTATVEVLRKKNPNSD